MKLGGQAQGLPFHPGVTGEGKAGHIGGVTVLTNAKGYTLYWFAPDTATRSACYGTCAAYWPPVRGAATAGPGVTGRLGTITRSDGPVQATYDGHPLYTYVGDTAAGQANGNRLKLRRAVVRGNPVRLTAENSDGAGLRRDS